MEKFKLKTDTISYVSNIESIKSKVSVKENIFKSLMNKDSVFIISILKDLDKRFKIESFSKVVEITQLEFSLESVKRKEIDYKEETFIGDFLIQEWVFKNRKEALEAYSYIPKVLEQDVTDYAPLNRSWLCKKNLIYFISSDSYSTITKEFVDIYNIVKESIK